MRCPIHWFGMLQSQRGRPKVYLPLLQTWASCSTVSKADEPKNSAEHLAHVLSLVQILQEWVAETEQNPLKLECLCISYCTLRRRLMHLQAREKAQAKMEGAGGSSLSFWPQLCLLFLEFFHCDAFPHVFSAGSQLKSNAAALNKVCAICKVRKVVRVFFCFDSIFVERAELHVFITALAYHHSLTESLTLMHSKRSCARKQRPNFGITGKLVPGVLCSVVELQVSNVYLRVHFLLFLLLLLLQLISSRSLRSPNCSEFLSS
jgi:hypothetical protein